MPVSEGQSIVKTNPEECTTPERLSQIEDLFHSAREREPGERAAFLAAACREDEELRGEVESLLASEGASSALLGAPMREAAEMLASQQVRSQLAPGVKLGPYVIEARLGSGGMGEVYRARDSRLKREVAIKVLPVSFARDPDRIARFEREARAASALNHPNIVSVYDIGRENSTYWIVSELVDGETLRRTIDRGPMPARKAIEIAAQIAEGLAAAHAAGIVHRDLKPGNIMFARDGRVKILDFGLAKRKHLATDSNTPELTNEGMVLGTAGYMSPEQVRGEDVDHRSDIFSFGVILYEMLAGKQAFSGSSSIEVMNAILKEDPPELPLSVPPGLERIVRHCLEKEPGRRFQSAADLGFALTSVSAPHPASPADLKEESSSGRLPLTVARRFSSGWLAAGATIMILAGLLIGLAVRKPTQPTASFPVVRAVIKLESGLWLDGMRTEMDLQRPSRTAMAISKDGRFIVYSASTENPGPQANAQLYLRRTDQSEAKPIAGTEGGINPFLSPDDRWVGFWADGKLMKVSIDGGVPVTLCNAEWPFGASWALDNSILTRCRAMYGTRNLERRAAAFLIVSRPGRQAMVDLGLVPECPRNSMTSAAAMHGLVAVRPCKRPGPTPLESL